MRAAGCAPRMNSLIAQATVDGAEMPPISSEMPMPGPAAVVPGAYGGLEVLGQRDGAGGGIEGGRRAVGLVEAGGHRALGEARGLAQHGADGVAVEVAEVALTEDLVDVERLEQVELEIADVALVMAHEGHPGAGRQSGTVPAQK